MPRLSVVVTCASHDAASHLADCVTSVVEQSVTDLEVLLVGCPEAPDAPAMQDPRVRTIVHESDDDARNAGATAAEGEFLAFVDAADLVTPDGYERLLDALDASGSDLATGASQPLLAARGGAATAEAFEHRPRTHVTELPALLNDELAGNKVWRRSFWEQHGLRWPDAPRVDALLTLRSHLVASAVSVITEAVHLRRVRAGEDRPRNPRFEDMVVAADRLDALLTISRELGEQGRDELKAIWDTSVLSGDLRWTVTYLNEADDATQKRVVDTSSALLVGAGPEAEASMKAIHRLKYHLARRRLLPELLAVVKFENTNEIAHTRVVRRGLRYYGDYPFRTDRTLRVPAGVYRLDKELRVRARVEDVWWEGETLHLTGYAHIPLLDVARRRSGHVSLSLVPTTPGRKRIRLKVERVQRPDVTADSKDSRYNYDWAGFHTTVAASALQTDTGWSDETWRLRAMVLRGGVRRLRWVTLTAIGRARRPDPLDLPGGARLVPTTDTGAFGVEADTVPALVTGVSLDEGTMVLTGLVRRGLGEADDATMRLTTSSSGAAPAGTVVLAPGDEGRTFEARASLSALGGLRGAAGIKLQSADGKRLVTLRAATGLAAKRLPVGDGMEVVVRATSTGRVEVLRRPVAPELRALSWAEPGPLSLEVDHGAPAGDDVEIVLHAKAADRAHVIVAAADGNLSTATFDPAAVTTLAGTLPLTSGIWEMSVRRDGGALVPLEVGSTALGRLPVRHVIGAKSYRLQEVDRRLQLSVGPDLHDDERGLVNQRRLQSVEFPAFLAKGMRDEVLFESYQSRAYADNARAVYEELTRRDLGLTCSWVVLDGQTDLPEGLNAVRHSSREHFESRARARYVVAPNYRALEGWLKSPPEQVVVQTWHGAPFKRIGLDNERGQRASASGYPDALRRESARWDYLLSPNPPSTPILRGAFAYEGEMLETGYPRCDIFFRPDREAVAARVRERLGLTEDKKVVLYAPTMRDDHRYASNRYLLDMRLDLDRARAALGDDHVLLVRRHAKVVDTVTSADGVFARDVSLWPDVNELLLAADVLVTDYSSLLFDFANTGRPMLFFTYDLADYRDRLRGFYFDVERLPGPRLMTSDEVISAIREASQVREEYDAAYRAFVADFCTWDDGGASARFVDRVFAGG